MTHKTGFRNLTEAYKTLKEGVDWQYDALMGDFEAQDAVQRDGRLIADLDDDQWSATAKYYHYGKNTYVFYDTGLEIMVAGVVGHLTPEQAQADFRNSLEDEDISNGKSTDDGHQFGRNRYTSYS